jgi:uncharacterized protein YodC (DUF2158 family)
MSTSNPVNPKFSVGDLVKLKSGGPPMTVNSVGVESFRDGKYEYYCKWFAGAKDNSNRFAEGAIEKIESQA